MKTVAFRSLVFALVPLALAVLTDLLLWVFYQGAQPAELRDQIILLHGVFFFSILILAMLGAFISFLIWRGVEIRTRAILLGGLLFAVATFIASMPAFAFGGPIGLGAWLLVGAALFAAGACKWGGVNAG